MRRQSWSQIALYRVRHQLTRRQGRIQGTDASSCFLFRSSSVRRPGSSPGAYPVPAGSSGAAPASVHQVEAPRRRAASKPRLSGPQGGGGQPSPSSPHRRSRVLPWTGGCEHARAEFRSHPPLIRARRSQVLGQVQIEVRDVLRRRIQSPRAGRTGHRQGGQGTGIGHRSFPRP